MRRVLFISYDFPIGVLFFDDWSMHFHSKKKKRQKKRQKKNKPKKKKNKNKMKKKTKKKKSAKICLCLISYSIDFFVVGFIIGGLSEIFMRDELRESSLRSFVP